MDETFVFANERGDGGTEVLVNFGVHAGREATQAEVERLGHELLAHTDLVDVVCEQRYRFDRERGLAVYQVRVETLTDGDARDAVVETIDAWARDCLAERRLMTP
jgi:hypothetical protein